VTLISDVATIVRTTGGPPAPGQTVKQFVGSVSVASGATVNLYTVTAGKTFYITDIIATSSGSTAFDIQVQAAGVAIFQAHVFNTAPVDACGMDTQPQAAGGQLVRIVAGTASGTTLDYNVYGYES
jgi:hypothetical protein